MPPVEIPAFAMKREPSMYATTPRQAKCVQVGREREIDR